MEIKKIAIFLVLFAIFAAAAFAATVSHTAPQIKAGLFDPGNFTFNGTLKVNNASGATILVVNTSLGMVGIGVISPNYLLHVDKTSGGKDVNLSGTIYVNGSSGNVGIGTTNPTVQLDIQNTVTNVGGRMFVRADTAILDFRARTSDASGTFVGLSNANLQSIESGLGNFLISTTGAYNLSLATNRTERVRITSDGNVGIGTTSPVSPFHVSVNNPSWAARIDNANLTGDGLVIEAGSNSSDYSFAVNNGASTATYFVVKGDGNVGIGTTAPNYLLQINSSDRALNVSGALYVNGSSGMVGIGTTNPGYKLDVSGTTHTYIKVASDATNEDAAYRSEDGTTTWVAGLIGSACGAGNYAIYTNACSVVVDTTGNVGIGTTSPAQILDIRKEQNSSTTIQIRNDNNTGTSRLLLATGASANVGGGIEVVHNSSTSGDAHLALFLGTGSQERMRIDKNGRVGIGTTIPNATLHVAGDILINSSNGVRFLKGINSTNVQVSLIGVDSSDFLQLGPAGSGLNGIRIFNSNAEVIRIDNSGSVGIGTTTPNYLLQINSSNNALNVSGVLYVNGSSGRVGIGTTSPAYTLEVETAATTSFGLMSGTGITGLVIEGTAQGLVTFDNQNGEIMQMQLNRNVAFTGGSVVFTGGSVNITNGNLTVALGNVGIGNSSPTYRLHVEGNASINNTLYVLENGKVGIGDSTPDYGLDVVADVNSDDCFREAGTQVAGTCASDIRLKKNIRPLQGSLNKILQLKPVEFEWKENIDELGGTIRYVEGRQVGLVAQDVQQVLPHLVHEKGGYLSVEYNLEMQMMLINAVQELSQENQELKQLVCLDHPDAELCKRGEK